MKGGGGQGGSGAARTPWWRRALREPLLHFLALGVLLFAAEAWFGAAADPDRRIAISRAEVDGLAAMWSRGWGRPPSAAELQALVDARIREEVLAREAMRLGLDRDDVVVRRRLAQKMEFLLADAAAVEPSAASLEAFFAERGARYAAPARLGFRHVFFSRERRADAEADALAALAALRRGGRDAAAADGDPIPLEPRYADVTNADVAALFGAEFAAALSALTPGRWEGPVASSYGVHVVHLDERRPAEPARLAEVRERVISDWQYAQREALERAVYEELREGYEIAVEFPEPTRVATGGAGE